MSQNAGSKAISKPGAQINVNAPIRILSPGDNGKVEQSNGSSATSSASNDSKAVQLIGQGQESSQTQDGSQWAAGGKGKGCGCSENGGPTFEQGQSSDQSQNASNSVSQDAESTAVSKPGHQANLNAPIRLLSPGDDGKVDQSNGSSATSSASNESTAIQLIDQGQVSSQSQDGTQKAGCCDHGKPGYGDWKGKGKDGCGCGEHASSPWFGQEQSSNQSQNGSNSVSQNAESKAFSKPGKQVNLNAPIRVVDGHGCGCEYGKAKGKGKSKSGNRPCGCGPGKGKDKDKGGSVEQSNGSTADSSASNKSWAAQGVAQWQANRELQKGQQRL